MISLKTEIVFTPGKENPWTPEGVQMMRSSVATKEE
jgi:hypothetical protein